MDLDDLLKSIREEKDEEVPKGLDDLLSSIRGGKKKTINVKKFVGEDKYDKYYQELLSDGRIGGDNVTPSERKEGVKTYKKDKIEFKSFVDRVFEQKKSVQKLEQKSSGGGGDVAGNIGGVSAKPTQKLLPGTAQPESEQEQKRKQRAKVKKDPLIEKLDAILKSTTSIEKLMAKDLKLDKKLAEKERKRLEKEKGEKKEKFREGFMKKVGTSFKKLLKPAMGLFERLFKALGTMLFYGALMRIVDWIGDKENQRKLGNVFRFLSKFWPALLAIYLIFGNGLTRTLLKMTGSLLRLVPKLIGLAFKLGVKAAGLLGKVPKPLLIGGALFAAGAAIPMLMPDTVDEQERKTQDNVKKKGEAATRAELEKIANNPSFMDRLQGRDAEAKEQLSKLDTGETKKYGFNSGGLVPSKPSPSHGTGGIVKGFTGGGPVRKSTFNSKNGGKNSPPKNDSISFLSGGGEVQSSPSYNQTVNLQMSGGGQVPGIFSPTINYLSGGGTPQPQGTDTVPAMLTPGEFVMRKGAVNKIGVGNLEKMNASGGGTNKPKLLNNTMYAAGGGSIEVKGTGNSIEGELVLKNADGKRVGKKYLAISGTNSGKGVSQKARYDTRNAPMPDGNYSLVGFDEHGNWPGLPGIGHWSSFIGNSSGSIGSRSGLMLHNDINSDGTLGCIGVELGGRAGTKAEQEFLETYKQVKPKSIKIALGAGGGDASDIDSVDSSGGSRTATPDNDAAAAQSAAKSSGGLTPVTSNVSMSGYRKDSAGTLSPTQSRYSVNPLVKGKTSPSRGINNAAELSQTSPSEMSQSESNALVAASNGQANKQTQSAASAKGSRNRNVSAEDPNNMVVFSNRALHNIIL